MDQGAVSKGGLVELQVFAWFPEFINGKLVTRTQDNPCLDGFLVTKAGPDFPWHISRFYPQYKYADSAPTPPESLQRAYEIGKQAGLHHVYLGNVPGSKQENTYCFKCGKVLIERLGYHVAANNIKDSKCPDCGTKIAGRWA